MTPEEINALARQAINYSDDFGAEKVNLWDVESAIKQAIAATYDTISRDIQQVLRQSESVDRLKLKNKFAALGQKYADKARELR